MIILSDKDANVKTMIDTLLKAEDARADLEEITNDLVDRLEILDTFAKELPSILASGESHLVHVKNLREDLKVVNDTLLLILNNLDIRTAIPTDTTGSGYIPFE